MLLNLKNYIYALFIVSFIPLPSLSESLGRQPGVRGYYYTCPQGVTEFGDFWQEQRYRDYDREYSWVKKNDIDVNLYVGKSISSYTESEKEAITEKLSMSELETRGQYKLSSVRFYSETGHPNILLVLNNNESKRIMIKPRGWYGRQIWDNNNRQYFDVYGKYKTIKRFCSGGVLRERVAEVIELPATDAYGSSSGIPLLILVKDSFTPLGEPNKSDAPKF